MPLPLDACDCHVHLFGSPSRYPLDPGRIYTPGEASATHLNALHRRIGMARVVLIQPSVYGTNNTCLLDGLKSLGTRARGVAVIGLDTTDADLSAMHAAGVRGVRVNIATHGMHDPEEAWRLMDWNARRIHALGWHVQVLTTLPTLAALADRIPHLVAPLVVDHFGYAMPEAGIDQPGFAQLCRLVHHGLVYVKLSAIERLTGAGRNDTIAPLINALARANGAQVLFGTDWPHTGGARDILRPLSQIEPFAQIDDVGQVATVLQHLPDPATIHACFSSNPARLYDFERTKT